MQYQSKDCRLPYLLAGALLLAARALTLAPAEAGPTMFRRTYGMKPFHGSAQENLRTSLSASAGTIHE